MIAALGQDLRYALRQLRKNPGFTAVAFLTLALGIGATTAIFSVVYGVLLRPLPYADPSRIVAIFEIQPKGGWNRIADPNFDDFRDQSHSFQAIAKYSPYTAAVSGGSQPTRSMVARCRTQRFVEVLPGEPMILDAAAADACRATSSKRLRRASLANSASRTRPGVGFAPVIRILPIASEASNWTRTSPNLLASTATSRASRSAPVQSLVAALAQQHGFRLDSQHGGELPQALPVDVIGLAFEDFEHDRGPVAILWELHPAIVTLH